MTVTKHIGTYNDQKVIVVLHQIPGEEHMALCVFYNTLSQAYQAPLMEVLNSSAGQQADDLATALDQYILPSGKSLSYTLHTNGCFKKLATNAIYMTPSPAHRIKLSDLNTNLGVIRAGGEALAKMQYLEEHAGLSSDKATKMLLGNDAAQTIEKALTEVPVYSHPVITNPPAPTPALVDLVDTLAKQVQMLTEQVSQLNAKKKKAPKTETEE